ncbi:hypothetical protein [Vandammella animalimorsus]|uniref:hypothetical protein n=1 Tax=Vandammella animalimorsus TaxID=2029117 RepID=UPI000BAA68EF|nr:hypothetical protein [Vandammella animalimorsus]
MRTRLFPIALALAAAAAATACGEKNAMPAECQAYLDKTQACMGKLGNDPQLAAMQKQLQQQMEEQKKQLNEELKKMSKKELENMRQSCQQLNSQLSTMFNQLGC